MLYFTILLTETNLIKIGLSNVWLNVCDDGWLEKIQ
jgi:hypothetical protein